MASFPLGAVRLTEQFLPGDGPGEEEGPRSACAPTSRETLGDARLAARRAGPRLVGIGGAVRNLAAAAQRAVGQLDIGVQGFVITPRGDRRARATTLAGAAGVRARRRSRASSRARRHHPRRRADARRPCIELGGFDGIEATEAGLRDGVFLGADAARPPTSRCSPTCARRRCATSRSSTSPTSPTSSTSRCSRCRCTTRSSAAGCSSPSRASASCCGRPRCSTTSA